MFSSVDKMFQRKSYYGMERGEVCCPKYNYKEKERYKINDHTILVFKHSFVQYYI